ncbi:MAG: SDR family oxidoreductase [Bacteroidia bacterium]|nr:SDR family oxidoreductase [Bacteroidia bacterium]
MYTEPMLRDNALQDKVIVVTGGGSGLGRSMSRYFLQLGARVIITSRSLERLEDTARELEAETGGKVLPVACDVRNYEMVENMLARAVEAFGRVDVLVNNAAGNFVAPTEKLSHRAFDTVVDIVLKGSYNCALALGKYWIEQGIKGNCLSIVTTYAWTGSPFVVPSACGKAGVLAMTRSLAVEWGTKYGIRFNAIAPGPFPTAGAWERLFPQPMRDLIGDPLNRVPLHRTGDHQELANLAAYLVSDFSAYVNGEVVTIDGGEWLHGAGEFSMLEAVPDEMWTEIMRQGREIRT